MHIMQVMDVPYDRVSRTFIGFLSKIHVMLITYPCNSGHVSHTGHALHTGHVIYGGHAGHVCPV